MSNRLPNQLMTRSRIVVVAVVALMTLLWVRLADVQLVRGTALRLQADNNRFFTAVIPASRGIILDRYHQPLTWNRRQYWLIDDPAAVHTQTVPLPREAALPIIATEPARIRLAEERYYRYPEALSHVVGYVGPVTLDDLKKNDRLEVYHQVGKLGLERLFDEQLRGQDGYEVLEVNARGQKQRVVRTQTPQSGHPLVTTLDPYISQVAMASLGERTGAVVVLDASTSAVLAMVSRPGFDANVFSLVPTDELARQNRHNQVQAVLSDKRQLLFNRAASGSYPPGSVFKLVTALAGLEAGAIKPDTTVEDNGILKVGEYEYRNWYYTQYGRTEGMIALQRAIARSNDIYFYKAAEWTGPQTLAQMARRVGLGQPPGSELSAEAKGLVPDPAWKEQVVGEPWYLGNTYHMGIGQGDLLVSPLQIASLGQVLAHQGRHCRPTFLAEKTGECKDLGLQEQDFEVVLAGMLDACSTGGTAFPIFPYNTAHRQPDQSARAAVEQGAVACKTGTAEFGGADQQGYRKTHAWLLAIVEPKINQATTPAAASASAGLTAASMAQLPNYQEWAAHVQQQGFPKRIVVAVLVESDEQQPFREGSRDAAPIVRSLLDWMGGQIAVSP